MAIQISSTGVVGVLPSPDAPSFYASNYQYSGAQSSIGANGRYNVASNTVNFYVSTNVGNHFNPANGTFTAPVAGTYVFSASFTRSGGNAIVTIRINGATTNAETLSYGTDWQTGTRTMVVYMNVGDTAQAEYGSTNGTTVYPYRADFTGYYVG